MYRFYSFLLAFLLGSLSGYAFHDYQGPSDAPQRAVIVVEHDVQDAGIFNRRQPRSQQANPNCPDGNCGPQDEGERTTPYDPNSAPKFEAPPADGVVTPPAAAPTAPAAPVVPPAANDAVKDDGAVEEAELTPEQKQMLLSAVVAFVSALVGAFGGSGGFGPIILKVLEAIAAGASAQVKSRVKARPRARRATKAKTKT